MISIILLFLTFLASPAPEDPPPPTFITGVTLPEGETSATVPLLRGRAYFFVPVRINDRPAGHFLVDTGASRTIIDRRIAEIRRLPVMDEGRARIVTNHDIARPDIQIVRIDSMTIGQARVLTRRMAAHDLSVLSRNTGTRLAGVLGADVLGRVPVTLDLPGRELIFHEAGSDAAPDGTLGFDLTVRGNLPYVHGRFGGADDDALLLLDTGDIHAAHWNRRYRAQGRDPATGPVVRIIGGLSLTGSTFRLEERRGRIEVFGAALDDVLMSFREVEAEVELDRDGAVGADLLDQFVIHLDLAGSRVRARHVPSLPIEHRLAAGLDPNGLDLVGRTILFDAILDGDVDGVRALLDAGAEVNITDNVGVSPLLEAVHNEEAELVRLLVDAGAEVNATQGLHYTPLAAAASLGDLALVELLLDQSARADAHSGPAGSTALHRAASADHPEMIERLLAEGVEVDVRDNLGGTPLHTASRRGSRAAAEILLERGADLHARAHSGYDVNVAGRGPTRRIDPESQLTSLQLEDADVGPLHATPLMGAAGGGDIALIELLLEAGADVNAVDAAGRTSLMTASVLGHEDAVGVLIEAGADVHRRPADGNSALFHAAGGGARAVAQRLLDAGAEVDAENESGQTPLLAAVLGSSDGAIVAALIDAGADVNRKTGRGNTALSAAALLGRTAAAELLLAAGADVNEPGEVGRTVLMAAVGNASETAVESILGAGTSAAWTDAGPDLVRLLLAHGADPNQAADDGMTALMIAVRIGELERIAVLLDAGAFVNASGPAGITPLLTATIARIEVVDLLLDRGADPEARFESGTDALMWAAMGGSGEIVRRMLERGLHLDATDENGLTALHYAAGRGRPETARILLDAGADPNSRSARGITPLMAAVDAQEDEVVRMLIDAGADVTAADERGDTSLRRARTRQDALIARILRTAGALR